MATRPNERGFRPVRHLNGRLNPSPHMRTTINDTGSAHNAGAIFPGDVVYLDTSGALTPYPNTPTAGTTPLPLGVVGQCFTADKRPTTFNQPGTGNWIDSSTQGYAMVYEDPNIIYVANCSTTARHDMVGRFCQVRVCAVNTAVGRSGMGVDIAQGSQASGHALKMVGISPLDSVLTDCAISGDANQEIEVMFVNTYWSNPYLAVGTGEVSGVSMVMGA